MLKGNEEACFPRGNTRPPEILNSGKRELPAGLERSNTERQRRNSILAEEAAQIFDDRISVQQKVDFFLFFIFKFFIV